MKVQTQDSAKLRGLKALVSILGVLIVIGTAVVIGVVIKRIYASPAAPSTSLSKPLPWAPPITDPIILQAGSHITALTGAGNKFAVSVTGPGGDQLWLIDPQTGSRTITMIAPK